jgi:hypothetical protein
MDVDVYGRGKEKIGVEMVKKWNNRSRRLTFPIPTSSA